MSVKIVVDPFASKPARFRVRRGIIIKSLKVEAALRVSVVGHLGDAFTSTVINLTASFETEQEFLVLAVAEELKKEVWKQVFRTTD